MDRKLGTRMDEELKRRYGLPPAVAAQVKGALLEHELMTGQVMRHEQPPRTGPPDLFRERLKDMRGVRPKQLVREELAKALRQMKQQPQAP